MPPIAYKVGLRTGTVHMPLEMRPKCERCAAPLPPESDAARICSYECTFCSTCTESMQGRCPNCGGELLARPRRKPTRP
jgi:hypothetical protein